MMMILAVTMKQKKIEWKLSEKCWEIEWHIDIYWLFTTKKDSEGYRRKYGKRKFKEAKDQLASSFSDFIPGLDDFIICNDCDVLMIQVKEKLDKCQTREERIQLLTLIRNIGLEKEQFPFSMSQNHG